MGAKGPNDQESPFVRGLRDRSRGCPYCGGQGLAPIFSPNYKGKALERVVVRGRGGTAGLVGYYRPAVATAHCLCPLGRWMRKNTRPAELARIPDLGEVLAGRSEWLAYNPYDPAEEDA